jgi:peptidoglycan/xylan/chitin deacetylase (PgdA/CDA1 family)
MKLPSPIGFVRRKMWCHRYRRAIPLGDRGPIVTFSFDDFPRSALTNGAAIVERMGGRATFYVSMGLMGTVNGLGEQFRAEDLRSLLCSGHELATHTFSHLSARRISFQEFERDVERGDRAILTSLNVAPSGNFAYPYGEPTLRSKRGLARRMRSCRGTCKGFNGPLVDLNLLRANCLYGGMENVVEAKRLVRQNANHKGWLIFYSHDVADRPSAYGCSPALLEAVTRFAADHGARLLTVAEVMAEIDSENKAKIGCQHSCETANARPHLWAGIGTR